MTRKNSRFPTLALMSLALVLLSLLSASPATAAAVVPHPTPVEPIDEFADFPSPFILNADKANNLRRLQQGTTTETTRVNVWEKLKQSMGLFVVGLILICISPCLIWKNEGRHVSQLKRIDYFKNNAVMVDSDAPTDANLGKLVHFTGAVSVDSALNFESEGALNISGPVDKALAVKRTCYIYQRFEDAQQQTKKDVVGGGETITATYTVREDWSPTPQPATLPHLRDEVNSRGIWDDLIKASGTSPAPEQPLPAGAPPDLAAILGAVNPKQAPHGQAVSGEARVGDFVLSKDIIEQEPMVFLSEWAPVSSDLLPSSVEGCEGLLKGSDNILRTFPEGEPPMNGDCKVVYEYVVSGFECSFIVEQVTAKAADVEAQGKRYGVSKGKVVDDKCFGMCHDDLGYIWMVRRGRHSLDQMIDMAKEEEGKMMKLLRIVCFIALFGGWMMLFSPFTTALSVLPILKQLGYFAVVLTSLVVSCTCGCTIMAVAYIRYRPLLMIVLLVVSLGIWGIIAWRLNYAAENGGTAS